jgi:hypothetical protein
MVVIALEDIGIADLNLVKTVLMVSGRKAWRRDSGGEEKVACYFVDQLCKATKCRDACDVLVIADLHPDLRAHRSEFATLTTDELCDIIVNENHPLATRVLAAWYLAGTRQFPGAQLKERQGSFRQLLDVYEHLGIAPDVLEVAALGSTRTREAHAVSLPLIWHQAARSTERAIREEAPQRPDLVAGWPGYAFDMHCRAGRQALSLFADQGFNCSERGIDPLVKEIPPAQLRGIIGTAVFRVEGAAVDRRLTYKGSNHILNEAETAHVCATTVPTHHAQTLLGLVRQRMPGLHRCRQLVTEVSPWLF